MSGRFERIEVITGVARRRRFSNEEKLRIVSELAEPGAMVSWVARRHGIHPSLLFKWRKLAREGALGLPREGGRPEDDALAFVPVRLTAAETPTAKPDPAVDRAGSLVEIELANGCRLRVAADIDGASLHRLVTILKAAG